MVHSKKAGFQGLLTMVHREKVFLFFLSFNFFFRVRNSDLSNHPGKEIVDRSILKVPLKLGLYQHTDSSKEIIILMNNNTS